VPSDMGIAPLSAVARALSGFNREQLGSAVEVLIALMDIADPDPDLEDATDAEDDHALSPVAKHFAAPGPGCDIADAGENAWIEWNTMRASQKRGPNITQPHEDDEDDDPAEEDDPSGQCDEDGINTSRRIVFSHGTSHDGPGCPISDPGEGRHG
jgi:hypothetical protein